MKKFLTLFTALLLFGSMTVVHADYYVAGTMNGWSTNSNDYKMSGSGPYSVTKQLNSGDHQFKITQGSWSWSTNSYDQSASNVTLSIYDGNIKFTLSTTSDVTFYYNASTGKAYVQAVAVVVPSYTFPAGTTIYYDFRTYGQGVNIYNSDWNNEWKDGSAVASIISKTLSSAWEVTASTTLFRSNASSWGNVTCSTLPTEGQNMLVSTDGSTCHWDTYSGGSEPEPDPEPATIKLHGNFTGSWVNTDAFVLAGNKETASLTLTGIAKGNYQFGVRIGADDNWTSNGSAFSRANPSHAIASGSGNCTLNADVAGDYTFTWTYDDNTLSVTYPALPTYTVDFVDLASIYYVNDAVTFDATSTGVDNPTYTYYVKKGDAAYGSAVTSYTFAETGSYTVKVEVRENGAGDALKTEEQTVTVDNPLTLYYVNKDAWTNVNAYFFNPNKSDWPGDAMTATGDHTAGHDYAVYSYTVHESVYGSANVIFNNGNGKQTSDLDVETNHYFYNGAWYATLAECDPLPVVKMGGKFFSDNWADTENFALDASGDFASITLNAVPKGSHEFKVILNGDDWRGGVGPFTRTNHSAAIPNNGDNMIFTADMAGNYAFKWTYATNTLEVTYPALPAQSVSFDGLAAQILKGSTPTVFAATSSGITNPAYAFYVKEKNGEYGAAVASYTFNTVGEYVVKVSAEGDNTIDPVVTEENVVVYDTYTFTAGTRIYVDFTAMTEGSKKVNYPKNNEVGLDYAEEGAGTFKTIQFANNVTWSTLNDFIKTEKAGWDPGLKFSVPADGQDMVIVAADGASYTWGKYIPTIKMHGNFLGDWNNTDAFAVAAGNATASLTLNIPAKGLKNFGMRIGSDENWTSNGAAITRTSASAEIVAGSGDCSLNADIPGEYTFTWTYETNTLAVTYPELPEQFVEFDGLSAEILKGTEVNFAATSTGITNPVYSYFVKPAGGEYGSAVASYAFNAEGSFTVKVSAEGDNTAAPVVAEANVVVYSTYTFTAGTRIYVDFTAMTEGSKKVNYPNNDAASLAYDEEGAGTFKTIQFANNVTWSTLNDFIKTEKAGWDPGMKFTVPADGQNKVIVAADGASYTWGTYTPETVQVKFFTPRDESNNWDQVYAHSWDAAGNLTEWPGVEITASKSGDWYSYDVQVGANVLFHNNAGMQTANIENIQAAACYEPTAINYEVTPKLVTVTANAGCEIAYYIAGSAELIGGAADFDTNLPLDENNQIVFHDVKPGTYSFKINNGTWAWAIGGNDHLKEGDCASVAATVGVGDVGFQIDTKQDITITYYPATQEICLGAATIEPIPDIEAIGGKFIINAKGDTAVFSRGNLQYKQTSNKWRCAPKQLDWKGTDNLQMGNTDYPGWVDLFCWSIGDENNYGATSAYNTSLYYNKEFVDWGGLFEGNWSTLSIDQWFYMLYNRANADELWGMALIGDTLGMVLLPNDWTAPSGVTFVPGTTPTTNMWYADDCLDPTHADEDHWRLNPDNMPANKFTEEQWAILEAAGAVFCPYGGRRSGGYGNHTNRDNETVVEEYAYTYWENYQGAYWTSTVRNAAEGKVYWLPMMCNGCTGDNENWGRGSHGWWENGRYGHSVRLVTIIPRQYTVTYDANGAAGTLPTDEATYLDGAEITLAAATGLSKVGYVFTGWKFKGAIYNDTYTITNVLANEEIVFEAQWEPEWQTIRSGLTDGRYYTLCYENTMTEIRGASLWSFTGKDANMAYLVEELAPYAAGKPYIVYAESDKLEALIEGANVPAGSNGALRGTYDLMDQAALNAAAVSESSPIYLLSNNALYRVTGEGTGNNRVGANRAYIVYNALEDVNAAPQAPGRRVRAIPMQGQVATGIDGIEPSEIGIEKVLIDGQLFILRGEKMYDATGRLVK